MNAPGSDGTKERQSKLRDKLRFHALVDGCIVLGALVLSSDRHSIIERVVGGVVMSALMSTAIELKPYFDEAVSTVTPREQKPEQDPPL